MAARKGNGAKIRVVRSSWTAIPNAIWTDAKLKLAERALLATMLSKTDDWGYCVRGLAIHVGINKDTAGKYLAAIEAAGYLRRDITRADNGRVTGTTYVIYDTPQPFEPCPKIPDTVKPVPAKPVKRNTVLDSIINSTQESLSLPCRERDSADDDIAVAITTAATTNGVALTAAAMTKAAKTANAAGMTTALVAHAVEVTATLATKSPDGYLLKTVKNWQDNGYHDVADLPAQNTGNAPNMGKNPALDYHQKTYTEDELQHIVLRPGGGEVAT